MTLLRRNRINFYLQNKVLEGVSLPQMQKASDIPTGKPQTWPSMPAIAALTNRNTIGRELGGETTRFLFIVCTKSALDAFHTSSMAVQGYSLLSFG